jgi:hypothetical protein
MSDEKRPEKQRPEKESPDRTKDQRVLDDLLSKPAEDLIPWEDCALPSRGVYYGGQVPDGVVTVKAWGIQTDKILATQRLAQTGQALDHVYKKCVKLPNDFDHNNLLVGDRMFLLYYLRGITYGNIYEFLVECNDENCTKVWTEEYDLNEVAKTVNGPNADLGLEPFKVSLPFFSEKMKTDIWVKIRLLRGYDLSSMMRQKKFRKSLRPTARARNRARKHQQQKKINAETLDQTIEENLRMVIVEAMGDNHPRKIDQLIQKMHAKDTATIREFLRDNSPGIDTAIDVECPECGNVMTMDLPITESFFRPTNRGRVGEGILEDDGSVVPAEGVRETDSVGTESNDSRGPKMVDRTD